MTRLVDLFAGLGVSHVRLTGGEPLTRRGIADLAAGIAALPGVADLALSTNGTRLARHAGALKRAGVQRLNVSLDTLDPAVFQEITGQDRLADVLEGLREAQREGFDPIKVNCVVHHDRSENEMAQLLRYTLEHGFVLRLIEVMPMGLPGRQYRHVDLSEMGARLAGRFGLRRPVEHAGPGPARYWSADGITPALGVITPLSQHFCAGCNRVRLTADGTLYLCLGQEAKVPLGAALREGAGDAELIALICAGVAVKPERHEFTTAPQRIVRLMARTGG